jgi:hypothetical protein
MKNPINLPFIQVLDQNLRNPVRFLQVIIGPRQVGKTTTLLKYLEENHKGCFHYVTADALFHSYDRWLWEEWQKASKEKKILAIDEIQKCENWSETIKKLWDESVRKKEEVRCILLGSSSLEIQKGLSESLTGRFQLISVPYWNYAESEMGYGLNFEEYLKFGGYPGTYPIKNKDEWNHYIKFSILNTVIEKDILQFHTVKSPALFRQAFEILISYPAQEISYTKLLGQIQDKGNVELVKHYIQLFEGAFLIKALSKYSEKKTLTKTSSPKILPMAPALYFSTILDEYNTEERGRVFELLVGTQLTRLPGDLYYWREGDFEVDFVYAYGRSVYGIEVKSGRKKNSKGLFKFQEKFKKAKILTIMMDEYFTFEKDPSGFLERKG